MLYHQIPAPLQSAGKPAAGGRFGKSQVVGDHSVIHLLSKTQDQYLLVGIGQLLGQQLQKVVSRFRRREMKNAFERDLGMGAEQPAFIFAKVAYDQGKPSLRVGVGGKVFLLDKRQ